MKLSQRQLNICENYHRLTDDNLLMHIKLRAGWLAVKSLSPEDFGNFEFQLNVARRVLFAREHGLELLQKRRHNVRLLQFDDENEILYRLMWEGVK